MSNLIVIDAAAAHCAVAVFCGDRLLAERSEAMARGHAERLLPMIAETLDASGLARTTLDAVVVCTGPGGFTGARIGVAAARGLALGLGRPAVGVDWFEAIAHGRVGAAAVLLPAPNGARWLRRFLDGSPKGPGTTLTASEPDPTLAEGETLLGSASADLPGLAPLARVARGRLAAGTIPRPSPLYLRPPDAVAAAPSLAARRA